MKGAHTKVIDVKEQIEASPVGAAGAFVGAAARGAARAFGGDGPVARSMVRVAGMESSGDDMIVKGMLAAVTVGFLVKFAWPILNSQGSNILNGMAGTITNMFSG